MGRMWETDDADQHGTAAAGRRDQARADGGKYEARIKGPHITPGYWRQPELTAAAFDEEGYYRLGDTFALDRDPASGLLFRGRIAEDFKLSTGTWVHVGLLRARFIEHFAPLVRDVVIAGEGRSDVGALVFLAGKSPRRGAGRQTENLPSTGSSNRIARALVLEEPPSLDAGEMTDKGSINQRAVLARKHLVDELFSDSERVLRHGPENLVAIDVHTHAWKSALRVDDKLTESQEAMGRYFRYQPQHQTVPEMAEMYRKLKMAFVVFTVDGEKGEAARSPTRRSPSSRTSTATWRSRSPASTRTAAKEGVRAATA